MEKMEDSKYAEGSLFYYAPNKGAAVFFAVAFAVSAMLHTWQCYKYSCFKLTWLFPFCCLIFSAGFMVREYCAYHYNDFPAFIASNILIYMAPPLLELANYHLLGRILYFVPYLAPIPPGRVLSVFGTLSLVVEILSALGVVDSLGAEDEPERANTGQIELKSSLVLQLIVAALFLALAAVFHHRCFVHGLAHNRRVAVPLLTLYASTGLICARTIYRVIEYFCLASSLYLSSPRNSNNNIPAAVRYEWFFYVFEASIMLVNCVLFNVVHPRQFLPLRNQTYLTHDGVTEAEGPGWMNDRPVIMVLCDPLDIVGWVQPRKKFWEECDIENLHSTRAETSTG